MDWTLGILLALGAVVLYLFACIRIVCEYERGVLFFLGRFVGVKGPGLRFVLLPVYRMRVIDIRTIVADVPEQDVITLDNVSCKVNAVIYFRVIHADQAVLQVEHYLEATGQLAQTSLRSVVGANELDALLAERDKLNDRLQTIIDTQTDPWGIKVSSVEIKHVEIPSDMRRVMARQAEAERDRRAKVIAAEGEYQAAQRLADAGEILATQPGTLQLRYLQTLVEIAAENNSTTLFPIPLELFDMFLDRAKLEPSRPRGETERPRYEPGPARARPAEPAPPPSRHSIG
jgi:regulator of protease activity HflC (stomatin/prohibitin superfamily)